MGKHLLFAVLGIGIIISFGLLFWEERDREWKKYQKEFKQLEMETIKEEIRNTVDGEGGRRLQSDLERSAKSGAEIKQVYLEDLNIIDRCHSCHSGVADQRWADVPQPFTTHTEPIFSLHPIYRFGCTICHQGQGSATTTKSGHGYDANWKDPLLPLDYIEASCNQCHADLTFREVPLLSRGNYLIERLGCLGCHAAETIDPVEKIGSVLDQIKFKVEPDWVIRFLKKPRDYSGETRMPNFEFEDDEIRQIRDYLFALGDKKKNGFSDKRAQTGLLQFSPEEFESGKKLVKDLACTTCHTIEGIVEKGFFKYDKIGPELSKVGSKLKTEWLKQYLGDPPALQPKSKMPTYRLSQKENRELTIFLSSLEWDNGKPPKVDKTASVTGNEISNDVNIKSVESGKRLIIQSNCTGCHEIEGIDEGEKGPAWDGIAGKPIRKFDFGNNPDKIEMSRSAWIKEKILKPRSFRDSLKMPLLDISEQDAVAITTTLMSMTDKKIPRSYLKEAKGRPNLSVQVPKKGPVGELWEELKCLRCHSVGGEGGDIGPELAFEGSRVKYDWMAEYLERPEPIRPISAARMPDLKLKKREAAQLSDFIKMALVDNELTGGIIQEDNVSKKSLKQGKKLFSRKYGCIGCHQVGKKGGNIGPDVSTLGKRMVGDWVYAYLKNPQSAIPDAMMPNFGLTDEEAEALTDYLMSLEGGG